MLVRWTHVKNDEQMFPVKMTLLNMKLKWYYELKQFAASRGVNVE